MPHRLKTRFCFRWLLWRLLAGWLVLALIPCGRNCAAAPTPAKLATEGVVFLDVFGEPLKARGIALVDWDGYMANPAVKLTLAPASNIIRFPATVTLSVAESRMYFDLPSKIGANGPTKTITFTNATTKVDVYFSIFPDRSGKDIDRTLHYMLTEAGGAKHEGNVPVHVFNQNKNVPGQFAVKVDYSYDQSGFFNDPLRRQIAQQAADDWAYHIDNMNLDAVPMHAEKIWIYPPTTDFSKPDLKTNPMGYTGYLLELYGVQDPPMRAGGNSSDQSFQTSQGQQLPLRRSGNVAFDTRGNWNTLGWLSITKDDEWWRTNNRQEHATDFYSIAHHEMGHAFGFTQNYPLEKAAKARGDFESPALLAYHGHYPKVNEVDHLDGEIDDASRWGAFGNEYNAKLPQGRWLITKLDLLCLESIGYKIRHTFDLNLPVFPKAPEGHVQTHYSLTLRQPTGGLPWYEWSVETGALPDGLALDADTGVISGLPTHAGIFKFRLRVSDSSEKKASAITPEFTIGILGG